MKGTVKEHSLLIIILFIMGHSFFARHKQASVKQEFQQTQA